MPKAIYYRKKLKELTNKPSSGKNAKALIIGIGNAGRQDDGLGWAFLDKIKESGKFSGQVQYRYQLQIEDADLLRSAQTVLFVDASHTPLPEGFLWERCKPRASFTFTMHAVSPETILQLSQELYDHHPEAFQLLIEGEEWELQLGLSPKAQRNLDEALDFFWQTVSDLIIDP